MVTQAGRPWGLNLIAGQELFELGDPRAEETTSVLWRARLEELGIRVLGIRNVPADVDRCVIDGIEWEVRPMGAQRRLVPQSVVDKIHAAAAAKVPIAYWLWGEEMLPRPPVAAQPVHEEPRRDPAVIGVIPTAANRGVWCLFGLWFH